MNSDEEELMLDLENPEFQQVYNLVMTTNSSVYMTGRAGTGKSTFLKYIVRNCKKKLVVLAPTGIAAVNAGGVTLHSFFNIPQQPLMPDDENFHPSHKLLARQKYTREKVKLLQEIELIIIDEISMVRADILDFVNYVLQSIMPRGSRQRREPFGGKQLLLVGDAYQLEPVVTNNDWDILRRVYTTPFFFGAQVFGKVPLINIELRKVYRQHERDFLSMLDRVRINATTQSDLDLINSRVQSDFEPSDDELFITLCTRRNQAVSINETHLDQLDTEPQTYTATVVGEFKETSYPTSRVLVLKPGAQVIFVKNDKDRRWFNGTIARVVDTEEDGVWVETDEQNSLFVAPEEWTNVKYRYNEEKKVVEEDVIGSFSQIPLNLAWAITIHKSQGLTFDRAIIDITGGAFSCGQSYVALSRCRTLEGMVLRTPMRYADIKVNESVVAFSRSANDQRVIADQMSLSRAQGFMQMANLAFMQRDYEHSVKYFCEGARLRPELLERPAIQRLIARRLSVVSRLEEEVEKLLLDRQARNAELADFAQEYYLLSVECIHKYHETQAAIANLDKCLRLAPDHVEALLLRAAIRCDTGEYEDSIADCDEAVRVNPQNVKALYQRARVYVKLRNFGQAYIDLIKVISLDDVNASAYRLLSDVCRYLGEDDEAQRYDDIADAIENIDYDD